MNQISEKRRIGMALDMFIIALKAAEAIDNEVWKANVLSKHIKFKGQSEEQWTTMHHHIVTQEELKDWGDNILYYAASALSVTIDEADTSARKSHTQGACGHSVTTQLDLQECRRSRAGMDA